MTTESRIRKVHVKLGSDGLGYYVAVYGNGEPGPRSEGYGSKDNPADDNLNAAVEAAEADFPGLEVLIVE